MDATIAKIIVSFVVGVIFISLWWTAIMFKNVSDGVLFLPASVLTIILTIVCTLYLVGAIVDKNKVQ
jgi:apolipoprotein N-acyltransferase